MPLIGVIHSNIHIVQQVYQSIYGKGAKNHFICASKGFHLKLAKALSIIYSIISLYSGAEKSKEAGGGDLMQCETIVVMEFGVRGGVTGEGFQ